MRTQDNLYAAVIAFPNLLKAAKLAQRGKRFINATARFNFHLERELWRLHQELATKRYQPGRYHDFTIYEPKERVISAAPYRDRVVHHALHNMLEPVFDPTFIFDSYATRKGKGTHAAIARFQQFAQRNTYVLKCDIQKYFPSIDRGVLQGLIRKKVRCADTLWLIETILASHTVDKLHSSSIQVGIPIGNLTSQFFANIYLNGLDHFIKEVLGCRYYLRYMDDFVIFHEKKDFLWSAKTAIQRALQQLHLSLHERKCRIFSTKSGAPFLGLIIAPHRRRLLRNNVIRWKRKLRQFQRMHEAGAITWPNIQRSIRSWVGYAQHADTQRLRSAIFHDFTV